jgi:hypothetical protein
MQLDDLEAHVFRQEQAAAVRKAIDALSPRERVVIVARFGLDGGVRTLDETAGEIGEAMGHTPSRERVRQIEQKALRHLKARGGLHDVAGVKNPAKTFNAAEFAAHQQALKAQREKAEQWLAQRAAQARHDAEDFAAQQRAQRAARKPWAEQAVAGCSPWSNPPSRPVAGSVQVLSATPQQPPSNHYNWMQRMDDLARWRAGGPPINPFDWMKD